MEKIIFFLLKWDVKYLNFLKRYYLKSESTFKFIGPFSEPNKSLYLLH